ncbi:sugar phosphate isomerase/epimerase family protein [Paenibacillus silvisoli]|uniref:sugar phosphate isomerase/epimerase family protein n=1 Tax=Paenibacillus silvisoli TaxID=3110539 RepID=UPI0028048FDE|nr:sugar phosphate isomerase/epimerase [Paenibacillus silvisoli]
MRFIRMSESLLETSMLPPGLQLYTLRSETKDDMLGTLEKVARIGYRNVEFFGYGGIPTLVLRKALDHLGLSSVSTYVDLSDLEANLDRHLQDAGVLGIKYIVTNAPKERFTDDDAFRKMAASLQYVSDEVRRRGMKLLYHPHEYEFLRRNGQTDLDRLLNAVGRERMQLAPDLYWIRKGGLDPVGFLQKYRGVVPLTHVKEMDASGGFTELGRGITNWPEVFEAMKRAGVRYYFVEQDVSSDPLASVQSSFNYLRAIGEA